MQVRAWQVALGALQRIHRRGSWGGDGVIQRQPIARTILSNAHLGRMGGWIPRRVFQVRMREKVRAL